MKKEPGTKKTYKVSESLLPFGIAAEDLIGFLNSRPFAPIRAH